MFSSSLAVSDLPDVNKVSVRVEGFKPKLNSASLTNSNKSFKVLPSEGVSRDSACYSADEMMVRLLTVTQVLHDPDRTARVMGSNTTCAQNPNNPLVCCQEF